VSDALKKDADAMRKEVHAFMHRQTAQQQEMEHALHAQVESLQLGCVRLEDCVTEARSKAHQQCLEQAGERSKMMAQMWGLLNELTGHQQTHETLRAEKKRAEEERASAVEKLDAARAEMEADAMSRMNEVALIKHLRVRLESTGVQLEESHELLRLERSDAEQQLAQARQTAAALRSQAQNAENKVVELTQKLQVYSCSLARARARTHTHTHTHTHTRRPQACALNNWKGQRWRHSSSCMTMDASSASSNAGTSAWRQSFLKSPLYPYFL
jgi:chromosome segregation ATPase